MTKDNKPLADVQPGGRVRLGDRSGELDLTRIAETVGAREYGVPPYRYFAFTTAQLAAFAAALSTQPSPGGQDAREIIEEFLQCAASGRPHGKLIAQAKDYLAARQPVGEPVGYATYRDGRFGSWLFQTRAMAESHDSTAVAGGPANSEIVPLFRSPAPAVDLGDFKALYRAYVRLLESGRDRIRDLGGACDPVDVMEANDVDLQAARRVIDSKAVGK
ncbi:hypothetical protein [Stenotrophomonas sp.]|uniref:hypothetical protein n=1 Tax=Stenotrophomonas sp. TaxID=69392 RepID=UPI003D09C177